MLPYKEGEKENFMKFLLLVMPSAILTISFNLQRVVLAHFLQKAMEARYCWPQ